MVTLLLIASLLLYVLIGGMVFGRAPRQPPNQRYLAVMLTQAMATFGDILGGLGFSVAGAFWSSTGLALFQWTLLVLLATMYVPQWFRGRIPPIIPISLPYVAIVALLTTDFVGGYGLIFTPAAADRSVAGLMAGSVATLLVRYGLPISSLVLLAVLVMVAWRRPVYRWGAIALAATLIFQSVVPPFAGTLRDVIGPLWIFLIHLSYLPMVLVLAAIVIRSRLFEPRQKAIERALASLDEGVAILPQSGPPIYVNKAVTSILGIYTPRGLLNYLLNHGDSEWIKYAMDNNHTITQEIPAPHEPERLLSLTISRVPDSEGNQGYMMLMKDVTVAREQARELELRQADLEDTIAMLRMRTAERETLVQTVRNLTMPVVPVLPGVLVLPLVGELDERRTDGLQETLLRGIESQRATAVVIDLTGVPALDEHGAQSIADAVQAAKLLGAEVMIVGIGPQVAQALLHTGFDLRSLVTFRDLQTAVELILQQRQQTNGKHGQNGNGNGGYKLRTLAGSQPLRE